MSSVITTDFERWKAQEAALGNPVALDEFVFANVPGLDPSKDISRDEKLPPAAQIVHRQAVNKAGLASENAVVYSVTLGTGAGDFVFNWIGLLNKESGTLAMITHAPEQRKIKTADGVQGNVLTRSFLLEFNGAAKETAITTSAETWQIDFTVRLAGMDESQRLACRDIYGAAAFFGDGFLVTKAAEQYRVTPGTAYIEGLRGTLEEITTFNNLRDTNIYADFTFQGNLVSKWQTFVKVTAAKALAHYKDAAGFQHYVAVIAEIDKNGVITDKRVKGTPTDRELAQLIKDLPEKYQPVGDYALKGESYTKVESNLKFQPAGSYVSSADFIKGMDNKLDKTSVLPGTGNSELHVMSQKAVTDNGVPVGTVLPIAHNKQVPGRYLKTNGAPVSRVAYAELFNFIGITYGAGDGSTTFNLPDTRDEFPRFAGDSRAVGSKQGDATRNFNGSVSGRTSTTTGRIFSRDTEGVFVTEDQPNSSMIDNGSLSSPQPGDRLGVLKIDASRQLPIANEFRPRNMALAGWIKY